MMPSDKAAFFGFRCTMPQHMLPGRLPSVGGMERLVAVFYRMMSLRRETIYNFPAEHHPATVPKE
jgi:hypothetical protein